MNMKLGCFMRAIRRFQACHCALNSFSGTAMRTYTSGLNVHESVAQSIYLKRRLLLYISPSWHLSSLKLFSHETLITNPEDAKAGKQETANALLSDRMQIPSPLPVEPTKFPSSSLVSSEDDDPSAVEEKVERSHSKLFFDDLQKCTSPCDILDLISKSPVAQKYPSSCLAAMWTLTKTLSEDQRRYEGQLMFKHPQFSLLCQTVMQEAKYMWRDDLSYSLHSVVKLGVPQNTRLVQTLLRTCQERLNEFDDQCLSVVATTLQGMEKCKNVEALQVGLRLLVEQRIHKISNVFMLQTMMKCIGKDAPVTLKAKLESKILSLMDQFTLPNAQHMFTVLAEMNHRSLPILNACSNRIIADIQGTPFWRLLNILRSCKDLLYRNVALFTAIAEYAASAFYMRQTKQVILFLSAFENLGFRPVVLMDIFAAKVTTRPESLNLKDVVSVLRVYSLLNHLPSGKNQQFLEALNSALNKYLSMISNVDLLRAVYSFCIMGYLPQPALDQLLCDEVLHDLVTSDRQNVEQNEIMLRAINACLELDGRSLTKPAALPADEPSSPSISNNAEIREVLLSLLGDGSLFRPNVSLTHGYNIDFEIVMDADRRKAIPNSEIDQSMDNSSIQRIAVLCAPVSAFCIGTSHPRGRLAMKIRHLRLLGYHVILVHFSEFQKMKKEDALQFLKGEIFSTEAQLGPD